MALTNQMNVVETVNSKESKKWLFPFILVTSLFFFLGICTQSGSNSNSPFKKSIQLNRFRVVIN